MSYSDSNQPVQLPPPSPRFRRLGQLLMLVLLPIILLGGLVLGFRLLSRTDGTTAAPTPAVLAQIPAQASPEPSVTPTLLSVLPLTPTVTPTLTPAPTATEMPTPIPPEQIVALINEQVVTTETVRVAQAVDAAMAALLGRPAEAQDTLLDRMVNLALTGQAADQAGFVLDPGVVAATEAQLLAGSGRSLDDLTRSLAQQGVTLADFETYLGQLLRSEQFVGQQAQSSGRSVSLVLQEMQDGAKISLGLAAAALAALPTPVSAPTIAAPPPAAAITDPTTPVPDLTQRERGISPGQLLPDFLLPVVSLDGEASATDLGAADLIGHPTVISFYTTWCPYCERQTPILVDGYASAAERGVHFVGIDVKEPVYVALPYIQGHGIPYPVLLDEGGSVAATYGVPGYPTTYFLDRQGQVVDRHIGALTAEQLSDYVGRILQ